MAEPNQHREEENLEAPENLADALTLLQKERIFVPPTVDEAVLQGAREHLRRPERPQSRWKPSLSWAAMAACLALAVWLGERFSSLNRPFAREDINRDGRVDVLDAFALARQIETGGTLDSRWDVTGDGRVNRADVNAIVARAVSLAQAGPAPKRSEDLSPRRAAAITVWRTEVRAPFFGVTGVRANVLPASCRQLISAHLSAELNPLSICLNRRRPRRFCGARLCEPQHVVSDGSVGFVKTLGGRRSCCGSQTRAPLVAAPLRWAVSQSCTLPYRGFVIRRARRAPARVAGPIFCRLHFGDTTQRGRAVIRHSLSSIGYVFGVARPLYAFSYSHARPVPRQMKLRRPRRFHRSGTGVPPVRIGQPTHGRDARATTAAYRQVLPVTWWQHTSEPKGGRS